MSLDKYQEEVVSSTADRILCLAGAGAGKSYTMLARIDKLVNDGVLPINILALTFTNAAAAEMRERYENSHPGALTPEFRTFHSFSYSLICKDVNIRKALGYTSIPEIASDTQEKEIHERAIAQCKITLPLDKLKFRQNLTRKERWQVELYDKAVGRFMKNDNLITFDMLNSEVSALFDADDISTQIYKHQYKYIFVDEFQDTDKIQVKFLSAFTESHVMVVGDALQEIYGFRGCSNEFIKALSRSSDWAKYRLLANYRSTKQICEYANKFSAKYAEDSYRIEMVSEREGEEVEDTLIDGPSNYDSINVTTIDAMLEDLQSLSGTSAILCRTNKEVDEVCNYLSIKGVEYTSSHSTRLPKLLECAISDEYMQAYLASHLTSAKYGEYIRLTTNKAPDIKWFLSTYGTNPKIAKDSKQILKLRDIAALLLPSEDRFREIKKILKIDIADPGEDLYGVEFLTYIRDYMQEVKSNELYVGTIHSVKGLEYDNVCVANVNSYCFQLGDEEMNNLFYVAITRAKNRLFVYRIY